MKPLKKHINAVKKTIKMWEWLRDNPSKGKHDYFIKHNLSRRFTLVDCYLCFYWIDRIKGTGCHGCPLSTKNHPTCGKIHSPFLRWGCTIQKARRVRNAQIIVDLCKEWLLKYNLS